MKNVLLKRETIRPFCSPYVFFKSETQGRTRLKIDLTPRLVAYFELEVPEKEDHTELTDNVVIGLSTYGFLENEILPGEDSKSFGFHGRDGNFYYNNRKYSNTNKKFGAGHTVGCGIDYVQQAIFFTYNGQFLSYAFNRLNMKTHFFPSIGMSGYDSVTYNFGEKPFKFNLKGFCSKYSGIVKGDFLNSTGR